MSSLASEDRTFALPPASWASPTGNACGELVPTSQMRSPRPRGKCPARVGGAGAPVQAWGGVNDTGAGGLEEKLGSGGGPTLCCCPMSRVAELARAVDHLRSQSVEKDQVNKALTEKLEALVRCRTPERGRAGQGGPQAWTQAQASEHPLGLRVTSECASSLVASTPTPGHLPAAPHMTPLHRWEDQGPRGTVHVQSLRAKGKGDRTGFLPVSPEDLSCHP